MATLRSPISSHLPAPIIYTPTSKSKVTELSREDLSPIDNHHKVLKTTSNPLVCEARGNGNAMDYLADLIKSSSLDLKSEIKEEIRSLSTNISEVVANLSARIDFKVQELESKCSDLQDSVDNQNRIIQGLQSKLESQD
ncbi:unnamed protein product, partial [Allacma fusca]